MGFFGVRRPSPAKRVATARAQLDKIPRPSDFPQSHAEGVDADRVLLFGSGRVVGWGTTSYADSLSGTCARALSATTGRGTDVDVLSLPELILCDAPHLLRGAKLWRFDLIIVNIGLLDAALFTEPETWRAGLTALLGDLHREAASNTRIVVLGIEPVGSISAYADEYEARANARARELDAISLEVVTGFGRASFLELASDATDYTAQAHELATAVSETIEAAHDDSLHERGPAGQDAAVREEERLAGLQSAAILDTPTDERFDRIVTMARQLYGTSGAAFALVDRDRVWHKSASSGVPTAVPKNASFCSTTIKTRGSHVVPDAAIRGLPNDASVADDLSIRFYAGYPVESPDGEQIGALCIFDEKPRERADVDETMLRQLALLIQAELQVDALHQK